MTVIDEIYHDSKYHHILLVEFYEWIARVAFKYSELKVALLPRGEGQEIEQLFRHEQVHKFVELLIERFQTNREKKKNWCCDIASKTVDRDIQCIFDGHNNQIYWVLS